MALSDGEGHNGAGGERRGEMDGRAEEGTKMRQGGEAALYPVCINRH